LDSGVFVRSGDFSHFLPSENDWDRSYERNSLYLRKSKIVMFRPLDHRKCLRSFLLLNILLTAGLFLSGVDRATSVPPTFTRALVSTQTEGWWTHFSTADGLVSDSIITLDATDNGYLWIGTHQGITLFSPEGDWLTMTDADGLGNNLVFDITPDPVDTQRRWFATYDGGSLLDDGGSPLDKADDNWITFNKNDGLVERYIWAVAVDTDGNVWFGTNRIDDQGNETGYGVSVLDLNATPFVKSDDTWTTFTTANSNLSHNVIHDIVVDGQGVVWIATQSGLNAYSGGTWTAFYTPDGLPSNNVTALLVVDDLLWVASQGGVSVLAGGNTPHDKADDQWQTYTQTNSGLVDNDTSSLSIDGAGRLWIGTDQKSSSGEIGYGVSALDANGTPFDRNDDTWATFNTSNGLAHNAVRAVAAVGSSAAWFGTREGLSRLEYESSPFEGSDNHWTTFKADQRLAGNSVYDVAVASPETMWLGTEQGLSLLQHHATPHIKRDDRWTTFTMADGLAADGVRALAADGSGRVWIGTTAGLTVLDTNGTLADKGDDVSITYNRSSDLAHDQVNDMVIDSAGRAWIACGSYFGGGLHVLDVGSSLSSRSDDMWATFIPANSDLPNAYVTAVVLGSGYDVWLGTYGGAARLDWAGSPFDKSDDSWAVFTTSSSGLAYNTVRDIALDQAGNVWFGLAIEGVSARSSSGSWVTFTRSDGLSNDAVHAVAVDCSGNPWLGTDGGGVSVLNYGSTLTDKSDDVWTTYRGGETLLSGNIRAIVVDDCERIWFGTFGGGASVYTTRTQIYLPVMMRDAQ
jgi:ligand-binding sensor domain-containing protein